MSKSTVVPFDLPSEFSPDPLTEVIRGWSHGTSAHCGAGGSVGFMAGHAHLLDEEGRQRLGAPRVSAGARGYDRDRHGAGAGAARARPWGECGWQQDHVSARRWSRPICARQSR